MLFHMDIKFKVIIQCTLSDEKSSSCNISVANRFHSNQYRLLVGEVCAHIILISGTVNSRQWCQFKATIYTIPRTHPFICWVYKCPFTHQKCTRKRSLFAGYLFHYHYISGVVSFPTSLSSDASQGLYDCVVIIVNFIDWTFASKFVHQLP